MLMQYNAFKNGGWRELGTWLGRDDIASDMGAYTTDTRLIALANQIVDGHCNSGNPLALLEGRIINDHV
jgi:hypothetical protein